LTILVFYGNIILVYGNRMVAAISALIRSMLCPITVAHLGFADKAWLFFEQLPMLGSSR
jgi:hypothetical protein